MSLEMTKQELADLAGLSYRRLHDIDKELPDDDKLFIKGEGGKYDLALFVQNWVGYNTARAKGDDMALDTVKALHEQVKMQKSELDLGRMKGELVDIEEVGALWADIATMVKQRLLYLPGKVAPKLVMLGDAEHIKALIEHEIRDTLTMIADTPLPANRSGQTEKGGRAGSNKEDA